jgi:hypothetical protein
MADDTSATALLERLCALQEEQLALTRQSVHRHDALMDREQKLHDRWERILTAHEQQQQSYEEREARHQRITTIRGVATLALWLVIAISLVLLVLR